MQTVNPGQTTIITEAGLPSGASVGFQVLKAATGSVAVGRTTLGVIERPVGSGNYVINFVAPVEGDLYLVVVDWSDGVMAPETTRVRDLEVSAVVVAGSSGLGVIADYAKSHLGGETWRGLSRSPNFGEQLIARAIETVKAQVFTQPPSTQAEDQLSVLVLDYLGICVALALIEPAIDYWGSQQISVTQGDSPTEVVTYANRANLMKDLRDSLLSRRARAQELAIPFIQQPVLRSSSNGPAIDEDDDYRSTDDPRQFPNARDFPRARRGGFPVDALGVRVP